MLRRRDEAHTTIAGILRGLDQGSALAIHCETMTWLTAQDGLPIWSRRLPRNMEGEVRQQSSSKWFAYHVEINDRLWSLWGGLHPRAAWFDTKVRGHQTLACCVVACCVASVFGNLGEWTSKLLDAIVVNGDKYYRKSINQRQNSSYLQLSLDDLSLECVFEDMRFMVQLQLVSFGQLYSAPVTNNMGLFEALNYFFTRYQWGILECQQRHFAFGFSSCRNGGYFIYDCSAWDKPIFPNDMGASYVLRTKQLLMLLYCMVVTLNVRKKNIHFQLYSVDMNRIIRHHKILKHQENRSSSVRPNVQ